MELTYWCVALLACVLLNWSSAEEGECQVFFFFPSPSSKTLVFLSLCGYTAE